MLVVDTMQRESLHQYYYITIIRKQPNYKRGKMTDIELTSELSVELVQQVGDDAAIARAARV